MRRILRIGGAIVLLVVAGTWGAGYLLLPPASLQPKYTGAILSPEADPVLRGSCFDCHSNETRYIALDYLPIALPLVAQDVSDGRARLNFSTWDQYTAARKVKALEGMRKRIESGAMPPWYYALPHPDAAFTPITKQTVLAAIDKATNSVDKK